MACQTGQLIHSCHAGNKAVTDINVEHDQQQLSDDEKLRLQQPLDRRERNKQSEEEVEEDILWAAAKNFQIVGFKQV